MVVVLDKVREKWNASIRRSHESIDIGQFKQVRTGHGCNAHLGANGAITIFCSKVHIDESGLFLFGEAA